MFRARFLASLVLASLLGGCCLPFASDDDAPPPVAPPPAPVASTPSNPSPPPAPPPPQVSQAELQSRKIAEYSTRCINRYSEPVFNARGRYLRWADEERGPIARERGVGGVSTLGGNVHECREAVTRAASMPPSMPEAERAADAYASAIETLQPLLARANTYYERGSYRDDDMAQGREMHGPLVAAFASFTDADRDLRSQVDAVQDAVRAERLARMANDPAQRSTYLIERTVAQALIVMRLARELRVESAQYAMDDPAAFIQAVEAAQAGIDELRGYRPTAPDEAPRGFGGFKDPAEQFLESALACMRRVRDHTRFSTGERMNLGGPGEWMVDGSFGDMQRSYNSMVDAYNRLR